MNKFDKFLRSKNGKYIAIGALVLLVLIAIVVGGGLGTGGLLGTAGIPTYPTYPMPKGGYTCLPTCAENDAKMFVLAGMDQSTLSNTPIKVWIMVPGDQPSFTLGIFDGDTSKTISNTLEFFPGGQYNYTNGNWDNARLGDTTYTLYADPLADGSGQAVLSSWLGNDVMLNNAWWETSLNRDEQAKAPNGHYYYRLEASRPLESRGSQVFKVRASGYLMTGLRQEWPVGLTGAITSLFDAKIIYPEISSDYKILGNQTTYNGDWQLYFNIPSNDQNLDVMDGDFDIGAQVILDTDDPNMVGKPIWATSSTADEGVGGVAQNGIGNISDDSPHYFYKASPAVSYEILDPLGQLIYLNENPSGDNEWEKFTVSSNPADNPDVLANSPLEAGMYNIHIKGLDLQNFVWIGVNHPICDPNGGCPPPVWVENTCPRPVGYWKKAVNTVYLKNKNYKLSESKVTLDWGLRNVALASKLYRSGIDLANPVAIENPIPLTGTEANDIMQKKGSGSAMFKRALQQNLAAWMNLGIGKVGPYSQVEIKGITGGDFSGTMLEALQFTDDVILDPAKRADPNLLKRAKQIASWINNNADNDANEDKESLACSDFAKGTFPEGEQPPKHNKLPKAPKPTAPVVKPNPAPVCTAGNTYTVENAASDPFYSVKFNFASGTEVKEGGSDTFKYTLPADVVAAMTNMQVEVMAAGDSRTYDLTCGFTNPLGCGGPVSDELYSVSFDGALDNGDGTYTLTFTVINYSPNALVHTSFSLPDGQTAGGVTTSFTSEICVVP